MATCKVVSESTLKKSLLGVMPKVERGELMLLFTDERGDRWFLTSVETGRALGSSLLKIPATEFMRFGIEAGGVDLIYITFYGRARLALVSEKYKSHLDLPLIGDPNLVVSVD
jgi:hypothetical protein